MKESLNLIVDRYTIKRDQILRDTETEQIFQGIRSRKLQAVQKVAYRKLAQLHSASTLEDLRSPGNSLEKLTGDREGQHSIRINDQYRLCFVWKEGEACSVEIVDYH